jgi:uncharacterized membrane protein
VTADFLFAATAVIAQPITGVLLAREVGYAALASAMAVGRLAGDRVVYAVGCKPRDHRIGIMRPRLLHR